ncbi:MAG: hypothetical protein HZB13_19425 [Acidobacteria bacterium]|nr:hypothetical protein [Acidobacteriota bacterium]
MRRVFILGLLASMGALAQSKDTPPEERRERYPAFRDAEIRLIEDYFRPGSGHLLPGLPKRGAEPPGGVAQQIRRGGNLPPALEGKLEPLPADLEKRIGPPPAGYRRLLFGKAVLLVQDGTRLIVDMAGIGL